MLTRSQLAVLIVLGLILWGAAAALIRLFSEALLDSLFGAFSLVAMAVVAGLSVVVIQRIARLSNDQVTTGVCVVGAVVMVIDGVMLRWVPAVYGSNETLLRLSAAWLLWGYGVSLGVAGWLGSRIWHNRRRSSQRTLEEPRDGNCD